MGDHLSVRSGRLKNRRIFIVEDNLENRLIAQMLLEQHGATVAFDRWGRDTVRRLHAFMPVDLILLDLMFPNDLTGYDVFDMIRAEPDLAAIPIVAVSAADSSSALPKTREKGFASFIPKPVDFLNFANQIADILDGKPVWRRY